MIGKGKADFVALPGWTVDPPLGARLWFTPEDAAWAVIEVADPIRTFAGQITEVTLFAQAMTRIVIPDGDDGSVRIRIFSAGLVREIQPCSEAEALAVAALQPRATRCTPLIRLPGVDP